MLDSSSKQAEKTFFIPFFFLSLFFICARIPFRSFYVSDELWIERKRECSLHTIDGKNTGKKPRKKMVDG